jgi:4a-hydroxytetrahydrobiopterin dehydratase
MAKRPALRVFDEIEIKARLTGDLARWRLESGSIRRTYATHGWKGTLMVVNAIGHLAEAAWHHPELRVSYPAVEVSLNTHEAGGITQRDFELAARIEALIMWRPANEGGALEGTPADERYAYVKYDA